MPDRPPRLPESTTEKISARLRYYEDIGIRSFYRDRAAPENIDGDRAARPAMMAFAKKTAASHAAAENASAAKRAASTAPEPPAATVDLTVAGIARGPSLFEAAERIEGDTLERISGDLGECTRCKLHRHRNKIVFGTGNPHAELVFVGEGPGHDEDLQGVPFVGRAGQLLNQMIEAMGVRREDVYIANVVKCRPPENRTPEKDEVAACMPFLLRQLTSIQPKAIVCLGNVALQALLGTTKGISHFRGQWFDFRGVRLMATYHPAYLLRNPAAKHEVWIDLKKVMALLGLTPPKPGAKRAKPSLRG